MFDMEGVEVAHVKDLRTEVAETIEEVRRSDPSGASDWKGWRFEVTDTSGAVLFTINLDPLSP